jgi:hypothetical protein
MDYAGEVVLKTFPLWDGTPEGFDAYIRLVEGMDENLRLLNEISERAKKALEEWESEK